MGKFKLNLKDEFIKEKKEKELDMNDVEFELNEPIDTMENIENIQVIITCTEKFDAKNLKFNSFNVINGDIIEE